MPLIATLAANLVVGILAALAAARELRASPRAARHTRGFRALAAHEALVATPVAAYLLLRAPDWMVSYAFDAARAPSVVVAALVLAHGALALAGYALGAWLLRDHRARWALVVAGVVAAVVALGALVARERVGTMATFVQYRGGFGLVPLWRSGLAGAIAALLAVWGAGAAHLVWQIARRL